MKRKFTKKATSFLTALFVVMMCNNALALDAPVLTVSSSGLDVSLSWTSVSGATGYTLYYAPYPYVGEHTIGKVDMGTSMLFSATLWDGATFYVAITANNGSGESGYSNIGFFTLDVNISSTGRDTTTQIVEVTSLTGRVWMDRNLGASRVATSSTDELAYGDLFQWGRGADGHEKRSSGTTLINSSTDDPGHGDFICESSFPYDWRNPQNHALWQGIYEGNNSPCPVGFRLPTYNELDEERATWTNGGSSGAFGSPLKLVLSGFRNNNDGDILCAGIFGSYWSSTPWLGQFDVPGGLVLLFDSSDGGVSKQYNARGHSIRCIKELIGSGNKSIVGSWSYIHPTGQCTEIYVFNSNNTWSSTSANEISGCVYSLIPPANTSTRSLLTLTWSTDNQQTDCMGSTESQVGDVTDVYVEFVTSSEMEWHSDDFINGIDAPTLIKN